MITKTAAAVVILLAWSGFAGVVADDTNYRNFLVGDRAAGMGGAVTASTADLDAAYYNPAGLAAVAGSRISLSVSLYGIQKYRVADGLGPGEHLKAAQFETIPSTFGSILNISENLSLAFAVFVPDSLDINVRESFRRRPDAPGLERSDYYSASFDDSSTWLGPSLGWRAGRRLRIGAGGYLVYRSLDTKQDWAYLYTAGGTREVSRVQARVHNLDFSNYSLLGILGAQYDLSETVVLGLAVQTPSLDIYGSGNLLYAVSLGSPETDLLVESAGMKSRNRLPARFTAGAAWRESGRFALEGNLSYHLPISYNQLSGEEYWTGEPFSLRLERKAVINLNLGGEYYVAERYPLRAGVFTNLSSSPGVDEEKLAESRDKVDMYGVSLSVGSESEHTAFSIGVNYVWGKGKTVGFTEDFQPAAVDQREAHLFVFLSSAYIF